MRAEIQSLSEQLMEATNADRRALADWTLNGGDRPAPTVPNLEERIRELQADYDASAIAVEDLLAEKTAFVEKHRKRLLAEANKETEKEHADYLAALDNLIAARERLHDARSSALWAALYPAPSMVATMPAAIALGLARPVAKHCRDTAPNFNRKSSGSYSALTPTYCAPPSPPSNGHISATPTRPRAFGPAPRKPSNRSGGISSTDRGVPPRMGPRPAPIRIRR